MAGHGSFQDDDIITGINVTPLVDITLVLLIIFMVTTTAIVAPSIEVDLPKAATAEATEPTTVSVVLTREGGLYLNGAETTEEDVRTEVARRVAEEPDLQVVIAADRATTHGRVVGFVDVVKALGVTRFAINTDPVDAPAADAAPPAGEREQQ